MGKIDFSAFIPYSIAIIPLQFLTLSPARKMPELRKDPIVNCWVIISSERGKCPKDFSTPEKKPVTSPVHSVRPMNNEQ
jgi:hypothetical protein